MRLAWKRFGAHLRDIREGADVGLREAARSNKISPATWSRAENGKPITAPIFLFLCNWMDKNPFQYFVRGR